METKLPEGLSVFAIPKPHRHMLRTSNWPENLNGKLRKRTSVIGLFQNTEPILRPIFAADQPAIFM
jgi:transposase-like protein